MPLSWPYLHTILAGLALGARIENMVGTAEVAKAIGGQEDGLAGGDFQGAELVEDDVELSALEGVDDDAARALQIFRADFVPDAYARMAHDDLRVDAYRTAIVRAVGRGARTFLDLGTGPEALLAIMCARAGAERVWAVEVVPAIAERARAKVRRLGLDRTIEVLTGFAAAIALPRVDVVVHEIVGNIATEEGVAAALADLQSRPKVVIAAREGWSVPRRIETLAAPTSLHLQVDLAPREHAVRVSFPPPAEALLGEPRSIEVVDAAEKIQLKQQSRREWLVTNSSTLTGFLCAPFMQLDEETSLNAWKQQTCWRHILVQLPDPVLLDEGDTVQLEVTADLRHFPVVHKFTVAVLRRGRDAPEPAGSVDIRLRPFGAEDDEDDF